MAWKTLHPSDDKYLHSLLWTNKAWSCYGGITLASMLQEYPMNVDYRNHKPCYKPLPTHIQKAKELVLLFYLRMIHLRLRVCNLWYKIDLFKVYSHSTKSLVGRASYTHSRLSTNDCSQHQQNTTKHNKSPWCDRAEVGEGYLPPFRQQENWKKILPHTRKLERRQKPR